MRVVHSRVIILSLLSSLLLSWSPAPVIAWGFGHKTIRAWAVERLPDWQRELVGPEAIGRLCSEYSSIQDHYSGSKDPALAPYCEPPGVGRRLHDMNPPGPSVVAMQWYLEKVRENIKAGQHDEAMKYLGVLCHWNEDPGSPSAHSSFWSEQELQVMVPPPLELRDRSYTFGYKHVPGLDAYNAEYLLNEPHDPRLLGATIPEAAARMYQHQRSVRIAAASALLRILMAASDGENDKVKALVTQQATRNARHVADVIFTALCLATDRLPSEQTERLAQQALESWWPDEIFSTKSALYVQPYYARPYLVNASFDSKRALRPLTLAGEPGRQWNGFGVTDSFALEFTLAPARVWSSFEATVGLHESAGEKGSVIFSVWIDDQQVAKSPPMSVASKPHVFVVPLPDADLCKLSLRTESDSGSDRLQNLGIWADPVLVARRP